LQDIWPWIGHTLCKGDESTEKTSAGLESAKKQKKRNTEENLEMDRFGDSMKMW
jgi:hypothetical protein